MSRIRRLLHFVIIVIFFVTGKMQEAATPINGYLTMNNVKDAYAAAVSNRRISQNIKQQIHEQGLNTKSHTRSAAHFYHRHLQSYDNTFKNSKDMGQLQLEMMKEIQKRTALPHRDIFTFENNKIINVHLNNQFCPVAPLCNASNYRTVDGSCNNLEHPLWGKSSTIYLRLLPPDYDDGFNSPRTTGVDGQPLPNVRYLSTTVLPDVNRPNKKINNLGNQYGQFIAHDMSKIGVPDDDDCCTDGILKNSDLQQPDCFPIIVPKNDYFYSQYNQQCLSFVRSAPGVPEDCRYGPREQLNSINNYIDGSSIYGQSESLAKDLRLYERGKLRSSPFAGKYILPPDEKYRGNVREDEPPAFLSGDIRCNENILLTTTHTLWFREHNRIAETLARQNPDWEDEVIFQEAKRITVALLQQIFYKEYLPTIFGKKTMVKYQLEVQQRGYSVYNPNENPTLGSAFSVAAFRFGHSLVQNNVILAEEDRRPTSMLEIAKEYFRPIVLYKEDKFEEIIRGGTSQPCQSFDTFFATGISNHLFQPLNQSYGLDMVAVDIQRGRDHGIPSYTRWRTFCGLKNIDSFDDLSKFMTARSVTYIKRSYRNVNDIDLFVGIMAELPENGEMLGPTTICLLGEQLRRSKFGDRFYFENGGLSTSFTKDQLTEIKKVTFARVVCDNSHITEMQPKSFLLPTPRNNLKPCIGGFIPRMNLELWSSKAGYSPLKNMNK